MHMLQNDPAIFLKLLKVHKKSNQLTKFQMIHPSEIKTLFEEGTQQRVECIRKFS